MMDFKAVSRYIEESICRQNPVHGKKIRKHLSQADDIFYEKFAGFLDKYLKFLQKTGKNLDFAVDCYLKMVADITLETAGFQETGRYTSTSFDEVNRRVYGNHEVMEYYMHGLLLSQFLWKQHYIVYKFFSENITFYSRSVLEYLEIGGGHGLYLSEAVNLFLEQCRFSMIDISSTSLDVARYFIDEKKVNYICSDINDFNPDGRYDMITAGEVIEHLEDPRKFLCKLRDMISDNGIIFLTVPTNAPTIDHIYLFRDASEIKQMIRISGLEIIKEHCVYAEDLPEHLLEKYKITMMYAAFLRKS